MSVNTPINLASSANQPAAHIPNPVQAKLDAAAAAAKEHTEQLQAQESAYHRSYVAGLCGEVGVSVPDPKGMRGAKRCIKGQNCIKALKRIRKEINLDIKDEKVETLLELGELRLLEELLLPLAMGYSDDLILLKEVTKLVVQLTMPPSTENRDDAEVDARKKYMETSARAAHLRTYKAAFLRPGVMGAFCILLEEPLVVNAQSRTEDDKMIIELVLWLIRNLLCIPDCTFGHNNVQANLHESFVLMLERECVLDILLHLAECVGVDGNKDWNLILLESFFHLFRGSEPDEFFDAHTANTSKEPSKKGARAKSASENGTSGVEKRARSANAGVNSLTDDTSGRNAGRGVTTRPDDQLGALLRAGHSRRSRGLGASSRHSRFGGAFQSANSKSASQPTRVFTLANGSRGKDFGNAGNVRGGARKRQDDSEVSASVLAPTSVVRSLKLRMCLRKVCEGLLDRAYGHLFQALIKDINRQDNRILPSDGIQFLWLASFCMRFQRIKLFYDDCAASDKQETAAAVVHIDLDEDDNEETNGSIIGEKNNKQNMPLALPSSKFSWTKSPTFVNMDLWSFQYVIKSCQVHLDEKKWACLQVDMRSLREMLHIVLYMQHSLLPDNVNRANTLQNSVFYELGELDVVSQLLRMWEPGVHSRELLADVCVLVDCLLQITTRMEEQGMVVQTARRRVANKKKKEKKQGAEWGAEETHALVEGVKEFGSSGKAMRKMLAEASYRTLFADNQRTAKQLLARWVDVGPAMESGSSLAQFMQQEAEADLAAEAAAKALAGDDAGMSGDDGDEKVTNKEHVIREQQMDSESFLRRFVGNQSVLNMCRVVDPALWEGANCVSSNGSLREQLVLSGAVANFLRRAGGVARNSASSSSLTKRRAGKVSNKKSTHKKKKQKRADSDESGNISAESERELTDNDDETKNSKDEDDEESELESLEPILWHIETFGVFQRVLASSNHLLVRARSEVPLCAHSVLRGHSHELVNLVKSTLARFFKHAQKNPLVVIEALFWRTKGDNLSISTNYSELKTFKSQKKKSAGIVGDDDDAYFNNNRSDDDRSSAGESEANFNDLGTAQGGPVAEWTMEEDEALEQSYAAAVSMFGAESAPRVIASHATFRENKRTAAHVHARAKYVLSAKGTETMGLPVFTDDVVKLLGGAELDDWVKRKLDAVTTPKTGSLYRAARRLLNCPDLSEEGAAVLMFLKEQFLVACAQRSRETGKSFALVVPPRVGIRKAWEHVRVVDVLRALEMQAPGHGERFWRVPGWYNAEALQKLCEALSQSVMGPSLDADFRDVGKNIVQAVTEDVNMGTGGATAGVESDDAENASGISDDDAMEVVRKGVEKLWKPPYFMSKVHTVAWMTVREPTRTSAKPVTVDESDKELVYGAGDKQQSDRDQQQQQEEQERFESNNNSVPARSPVVQKKRIRVRGGGEESDDSLSSNGFIGGRTDEGRTENTVTVKKLKSRFKASAVVSSSEDEDSEDERDTRVIQTKILLPDAAEPSKAAVRPKARSKRMVVDSDSESD